MNSQCGFGLLPFQGATSSGMGTQGVAHMRSLALGWELDGLSDSLPFGVEILNVCCSGREMVLVSRKGAKRRKEVEIPFTQIPNIFEKSIRAIRVICVPRNKLISMRLMDLS